MFETNRFVPGMTEVAQYADRQICTNADYHIQDRISITLAPNTGDLLAGTILGFGTADNLARPVTRTTVNATAPADPQVIGVAAGTASKFKVGHKVSAMTSDGVGVVDLGTVTVINGDNVTVSTQLPAALVAGDYLFVSDGSEKASVILADSVPDAPQNRIASAYVAGKFYGSMLIGLDAVAVADLRTRTVPYGRDDDGAPETMVII